MTCRDSNILAAMLQNAMATAVPTYAPEPDPKGIGRRAPTTPLDLERLVLAGTLTTRPAP